VIEYRCKSCWRLDSHHLRAGFHQSADCPSSRFKTDSRVLFRFLNVQRGEFLHSLDLADRSDADRTSPAPVVLNAQLDVWNGVAYESVPFEETPDGHYLSLTYYETRASYAANREHRRLLEPGRPQGLAFRAGRLMSRVFPPGSKLVVVVTLIRSPTEKINYGTGRDVADKSIADGKVPLRIRWLGSSFIDIPLAEPREDYAGRRIGA
jgi:hypothetical protein